VTRFLLRRSAQAVVVLLFVSVIVFCLLHLLPGGPARAILGVHATPTAVAAFNRENGLEGPLPVQYWHWLTGVLSGNLGFSFVQNESVASLLGQRLPKTAFLAGISVVLAVLIAVPVGFYQAVRRQRAGDYVQTTVTLVLYSTPAFWVAIILIDVLAIRLHVVPAEAPQGAFSTVLSDPQALVLPVLTITLVTVAAFSRYIRSSVLDELAQEYVRMARSKGAGSGVILFGHVLRNAAGPVVTLLGLSLPFIVSGTLITEYVFNYPGVGLLAFSAATSQDYPVILGVVIVVAAATVVGSLLADITHAVLDPRVRTAAGIG
jgi:peptide/nickel transport system permease protein